MKTGIVLLTATTCLAFAACDSKTPVTSAPAATARPTQPPATDSTPTTASGSGMAATPNYAGTYTVEDTALCPLSIIINKQADDYFFSCRGVRGKVQVSREGSTTGFTFVGLKAAEPSAVAPEMDDVQAVWEDGVLRLQNTGNSMNYYVQFEQCDAKYLELVRQP
ncbi:hypothetical protein IC235_18200 [Hymenobacter sp. BT664]|uniref:Lipoprotein n=1 Tax=Hymenobacter montanus TaxID=2771359 RepID=A0A927GKU0_9BACT|nr:hypothetical protein [Hymenobacter montanus]MBD2769825.1 hypothetical protein [Hymenobacter montanus]